MGPRGGCGVERALRPGSRVEVTLRAQIGVGPSGRWKWEGGCTVREGQQFGGGAGSLSPRCHPSSRDDHLSFPFPAMPSREDSRRSRPLAAAVCLTSPFAPALGRAPCSGVRTRIRQAPATPKMLAPISPTRQGRERIVGTRKAGITPEVALLFLLVYLFCAGLPLSTVSEKTNILHPQTPNSLRKLINW